MVFDRRKTGVRIFFVSLALLGLSACAGVLRQPDEVDVAELRRLNVCGSESGAAAVTLLPDAEALRAWQQPRGIDLSDAGPLPRGPFAVVEHGARNTGGYGLAVSRQAYVDEEVLTLYASFLSPGSELRAAMPTSPCVLVALPSGSYRIVELLDPLNHRRAISNPVSAAPGVASPTQK